MHLAEAFDRRVAAAALTALAGTLLAGCLVPPPHHSMVAPASVPTVRPHEPWAPPGDWAELPVHAFEQLLGGVPRDARPADPAPLVAAIAGAEVTGGDAARALRAALLLGALDADDALLGALERRVAPPDRPADAALVCAAARLGLDARGADDATARATLARLAALASGPTAHPDLEVRAECARAALLGGHDEVLPFLLQLLRLGTPLGLERDGAWRAFDLTTWARARAAHAIAERLAIPCPYIADAPIADREAAARALEAAWLEAAPQAADGIRPARQEPPGARR